MNRKFEVLFDNHRLVSMNKNAFQIKNVLKIDANIRINKELCAKMADVF